jgi:hypothetical protein
MSVHLTLVIDHFFRAPSLPEVSRAFEPLMPCIEEIAQRLGPDDPHLGLPLGPWLEEPRWPARFEKGYLRLSAPGGFRMWFGPRAVYMPHVLRFAAAMEDERWPAILSRFSRGCMRVLGSAQVLYCPSQTKADEARDGVMNGLNLPEILALFVEQFGRPAPSIEAMFTPGSSRYFVQSAQETSPPITR